MKSKVTFCEECREDVNYIVRTVPMEGKIKDKTYSYIGKQAYCCDCGMEVYVGKIVDDNLFALYDVFRKENNIISLDKIREIPQKYSIGKRPLSLLLGWGEQTFSRYYKGDIPSKQYSEILSRIYDDPVYFSDLLENNKERLNSELTYEKSRKAVSALLDSDFLIGNKINDVICYVLNQCEDITPLALQKTLYYIQGLYFAFNKNFLFTDDCQAWVHGPVYRNFYFRYRDYRFDPIEPEEIFDVENFTSGEKAIIDSVINYICCYSGKVLEHFTHNESPWLITRGDLPINEPSERIIDKKLIGDYFLSVKSKYNMINPGDIKSYAQEMFSSML